MRFSWAAMSPVKIPLLILSSALQVVAPDEAVQLVTGSNIGLDIVPSECRNSDRQRVSTDNIIVFHNKIVGFNIGSATLRSELVGGTVRVRYSDEGGEAVFRITELIRYRASDVRLYHATLSGRPVILWEETVENVSGRAGIIEYRGRGIFPICDGVIRAINHDAYRAR